MLKNLKVIQQRLLRLVTANVKKVQSTMEKSWKIIKNKI